MIGRDIIALGINYAYGERMPDCQNGFWAIRTSAERDLGLQNNITTVEQEMTFRSLAKGYKLGEVPMHKYARRFSASKVKLNWVSFHHFYFWIQYYGSAMNSCTLPDAAVAVCHGPVGRTRV